MRVALITSLLFDESGNANGETVMAIDLDRIISVVPSTMRENCSVLSMDDPTWTMTVKMPFGQFVSLWAEDNVINTVEKSTTRSISVEDVIPEKEV